MPYTDLNVIHVPATGGVPPATWGNQIRDNQEFFVDPPACSVFNTGQSVAHNTNTILAAPNENFDNDAMHDTVTNNSRVTAQTAGRYLLIATCSFAAAPESAGTRRIQFLLNGVTILAGANALTASTNLPTDLVAVRAVTLAATNFVEVRVFQFSAAAITVTLSEFAVTYLTR